MPESRYLYGGVNPVEAPVATAKAVAIGDLVAITAGTLTKAADETWGASEDATRVAFTAKFLGRSGQRKNANEAHIYGNGFDNLIRVDTSGIYEFDCDTATYVIGDRLGVAKATGNALENQKVKVVTAADQTIGRVERSGTGLTRVRMRLISRIVPLAE